MGVTSPKQTGMFAAGLGLAVLLAAGCGTRLPGGTDGLFTVPLAVEGQAVGDAIVDTGGGYEIMLRDDFGLPLVDRIEVFAFGGRAQVDVTAGFRYVAGGVSAATDAAIISTPICACNGVGFPFLRKTGTVLALDFDAGTAAFRADVPEVGAAFAFDPPPPRLAGFDSSFVRVDVEFGGSATPALALLDTGAARTLIHRALVPDAAVLPLAKQATVTLANPQLGAVAVSAGLYANQALPDVIIGADVMRTWGPRWYFTFAPRGGSCIVVLTAAPDGDPPSVSVASR
ncbi:MAG: hypothetical protein HY763_06605 [Planctomycetes bacterium]|nr:hypothetical protein [Planctomycetota bacterium]